MNDTQTPRTDWADKMADGQNDMREFSKGLERELTDTRHQLNVALECNRALDRELAAVREKSQ